MSFGAADAASLGTTLVVLGGTMGIASKEADKIDKKTRKRRKQSPKVSKSMKRAYKKSAPRKHRKRSSGLVGSLL